MSEPVILTPPSPEPSRAPTTTAQQDLTHAGQRRINLIWEYTQAGIAVVVVLANIAVQVSSVWMGNKTPIPESLSNVLFLVVGFYFSRTNHAAIGGVGPKSLEEYKGR